MKIKRRLSKVVGGRNASLNNETEINHRRKSDVFDVTLHGSFGRVKVIDGDVE